MVKMKKVRIRKDFYDGLQEVLDFYKNEYEYDEGEVRYETIEDLVEEAMYLFYHAYDNDLDKRYSPESIKGRKLAQEQRELEQQRREMQEAYERQRKAEARWSYDKRAHKWVNKEDT